MYALCTPPCLHPKRRFIILDHRFIDEALACSPDRPEAQIYQQYTWCAFDCRCHAMPTLSIMKQVLAPIMQLWLYHLISRLYSIFLSLQNELSNRALVYMYYTGL